MVYNAVTLDSEANSSVHCNIVILAAANKLEFKSNKAEKSFRLHALAAKPSDSSALEFMNVWWMLWSYHPLSYSMFYMPISPKTYHYRGQKQIICWVQINAELVDRLGGDLNSGCFLVLHCHWEIFLFCHQRFCQVYI